MFYFLTFFKMHFVYLIRVFVVHDRNNLTTNSHQKIYFFPHYKYHGFVLRKIKFETGYIVVSAYTGE